jgi:Domain of unknown function (DUF4352)
VTQPPLRPAAQPSVASRLGATTGSNASRPGTTTGSNASRPGTTTGLNASRPEATTGANASRRGALRRTRWPWAVAVVLVVIALGSGAYAMNGTGDKPVADPPAVAPESGGVAGGMLPESATDIRQLDRTVADGVFVVTVSRVRCGVEEVGFEELRQPAKGEFCLVDVAAENAGREAQLLDGGLQRAVDARGRSFAADQEAAALLNGENPTLLDEVPPGATVRGVLAFDVPAGTRLAAFVLHESVQSRGARVSLT